MLDLIQDNELEKAQQLLADFEEELNQGNSAENLELVKAKWLLRKQELRSAKS